MEATTYCIACKDVSSGGALWLGSAQDDSGAYWCDVESGVPEPGTMEFWSLVPLPGTDAYYLWNDNASLYACFTRGNQRVSLRPIDVHDPSFIVKLDNVGDGWVAINNSAKDAVFSAVGFAAEQEAITPIAGTPVLHIPWRNADYQKWMFADSNVVLNAGS